MACRAWQAPIFCARQCRQIDRMKKIDFETLKQQLLSDAPNLLNKWFPAGKLFGREFRIGNLRGDHGDSLSINIDSGIWKDFSGGDGGGDLISLYAAIHDMKQGEAAKALGGGVEVKVEDKYMAGQFCHPIPSHKYGKPTGVFEYRRPSGEIIGYVCRFDPPNERKQFFPLTCWQTESGKLVWKWKKWPFISPLYHADKIGADPTAKILIVEGEKKADRAQTLLPEGWLAVGWCGGAAAIKQTDWQLLSSRPVWIWPDNDEPGRKAAAAVAKFLPNLQIVDVPADKPEGWDLGDAEEGFDVTPYLVEKPKTVLTLAVDNGAGAEVMPNHEAPLTKALHRLNDEYAVILRGSQVLIMRHWVAEDGAGKLIFLTKKDFSLLQENNRIFITDDQGTAKPVKIGPAWLQWKDRQGFEEVYFEPRGKEYTSRYNLWRGFAIEPKPEGKFDIFMDHVQSNICQGDKEYFEWVMAWLADLFQKPARKIGTALVLRGPMGVGKGTFANHIGHLLGIHYMPITQSSQLTGKFNAHMADKVLMFVDEGWWSDEKYGDGVLRALITEPQVTIEMKGRDAVTFPNFTRFIIAANADWVVPVGMGDERRFSVLDVGKAAQRNKEYFGAMDDQMKAGGYEALLHYLLNYKYEESLPGTILKTDALAENKIYSMPDEMKWWHECLIREKIGAEFRMRERDNDIECDKFYGSYQVWCDKMKIRPLPANILPKKLKSFVTFNRTQKLIDAAGERETFYMLQSISELRSRFSAFLGHEINWDED